MSNSGQRVKDDAVREVAFGSITASYANLGAALSNDAFAITLHNNTDVDLYFSWDGTDDHYKFPPTTARSKDWKTNDMIRKAGDRLKIKHAGSAPSSGWASLEVEYV